MEFALLWAQCLYYVKQTIATLWCKVLVVAVYVPISMALMPHWSTLQALFLLFVTDFVCGVWVAKKTKTLSSFGMRRGLAKAAIYVIFISSVALAEHSSFGTDVATIGAMGLLAATEVLSITENLVLLGLPIPYAAKVLRMVSTKARSMGIDVGDDPGAAAAVKDMVDLLETTIPAFKDKTLRKCLDVYVSHWYLFMRDLQPGSMIGDPELVAERVRNHIDHVLCDIRASMTREGIALETQKIFLNVWNQALLARLIGQVKSCCLDVTVVEDDKIDRIRDQLVLMSLRLVRFAQKVDGVSFDNIGKNADATAEVGPTHH